jgi:NhaA family Na+:H+ antiporter
MNQRFLRFVSDRFLVVPLGAGIALIWANAEPVSYFTFSQRLAFLVNEIGMAFFFALLAQEVAEAVMPGGALHSWRRWTMPIAAAIGGMIGAAAVYLAYVSWQYEDSLSSAWPIACAIDATATYYLLRAIMPRSGAVPFALLLAIATDTIGFLIVAPRHLVLQTRVGGAALIIIAIGLAAAMRALRVRLFSLYFLLPGTIAWVAFYWEGLHPAFALIPIVPFLPHEPRDVNIFAEQPDDDAVHHAEHEWALLVQPIVFMFALVNTGVVLRGYDTASWAIFAAELLGRPIGILGAVALALAAGLHLPRRVGWRELLIVAFATSSGLSIGLFFATGLLGTGPVLAAVKIGIIASTSAVFVAVAAARALKVGTFAN